MLLRLASLLAIAMAVPVQGAALFPTPLHLVRRIEEPAARKVSVVEEYCEGNRVITVTLGGRRITIADYGAQELTEISRDRHEYSVTPFAAIAGAPVAGAPTEARVASSATAPWQTRAIGSRLSASGRASDLYELTRPGQSTSQSTSESSAQTIEVGFDRTIALSREALDVLIGAAYPSRQGEEHQAIRQAARGSASVHSTSMASAASSSSSEEVFALPIEQTVTRSVDGVSLTVRISIIRIDGAVVPHELLAIDPGTRQVESRRSRLQRELAATEGLGGRRQP